MLTSVCADSNTNHGLFNVVNRDFIAMARAKRLVYVVGFDRETAFYQNQQQPPQPCGSSNSTGCKPGFVAATPESTNKKRARNEDSGDSNADNDDEEEGEDGGDGDLLSAVRRLQYDEMGATSGRRALSVNSSRNGQHSGSDDDDDSDKENDDMPREALLKKLKGYKKLCRRKDREVQRTGKGVIDLEVCVWYLSSVFV